MYKIKTELWNALIVLMIAAFIPSCGNGRKTEAGTEASAKTLMKEMKGTYVELFSEEAVLNSRWDPLWISECAKHVGEEAAAITSSMLKSSMTGELTGEDAVGLFGDGTDGWKNGFRFNCSFHGGVDEFVIDGKGRISGFDSAGNEIFSHKYAFIRYEPELDFTCFKSQDDNNDEFSFFAFRADTPGRTHHIEFRYGSDIESLNQLCTGKYAYWMAAGVLEGNEQEQEEAIRLFVEENTAPRN